MRPVFNEPHFGFANGLEIGYLASMAMGFYTTTTL